MPAVLDTTRVLPVALKTYEFQTAASVGARRNVQSLHMGSRESYGDQKDDCWRAHIEGAAAEMAVAKALRLYWPASVNTYDNEGTDDVPPLQVRLSSYPNGRLIVRRGCRNRPYVLVTGRAPSFVLVGWLWAADAQRPEWLTDPNGGGAAYFVPQLELRSIPELRAGLHDGTIS